MIDLPVHPLDVRRVRRLGEMLCEVSFGELMTRDPIMGAVETLMMMTRPQCSHYGAGAVVDRLLAIADHRFGADALGEWALEIIMAAPPPPAGTGAACSIREAWEWGKPRQETEEVQAASPGGFEALGRCPSPARK